MHTPEALTAFRPKGLQSNPTHTRLTTKQSKNQQVDFSPKKPQSLNRSQKLRHKLNTTFIYSLTHTGNEDNKMEIKLKEWLAEKLNLPDKIHAEPKIKTEKAILIIYEEKEIWLPLSQISITPENITDGLIKDYQINEKITSAETVYKLSEDIINAPKEVFLSYCLDTKNRVISRDIVSIGILDASLIHPRETYRNAIAKNAHSIILVHNHPSGEQEPSTADKEVTKLLVNAGEIIGIKILDHIIVTKNGYTSMKEKEIIK
jgi:DNA repair protein RadC